MQQDTNNSVSLKTIGNYIKENVYTDKEKAILLLNEIVSELPSPIKHLIEESFTCKRIPKEYLFSSILFAFSNAAGMAFNIDNADYTNYANLYFTIVGSRGDTKSSPMDIATKPLNEIDNEEYDAWEKKSKEANWIGEVDRKILFVQNATIEAAHYVHYKNPYSIGIYTDEIKTLIEKMANKSSSEGTHWKEMLLQGFTNQHIDNNRKTVRSFRIKNSYVTLLGSIQHQFIPEMFANGNLESGFIDRIFFTIKLTSNNKISRKKTSNGTLSNYAILLKEVLQKRNNLEENKECITIPLSKEATDRSYEYIQNLLDVKENTLDEVLKGYISKLEISIHKLILLTHLIISSQTGDFYKEINIKTVEIAIKIIEFYFINFQMVYKYNCNPKSLSDSDINNEIIKRCIEKGEPQTIAVKLTGLSKGYVSKIANKLKNGIQETGNPAIKNAEPL